MDIQFEIGNTATLAKTFTEGDVLQFASLSEDRNPIHIDPEAGGASVFGAQVVHGMLVASLISGLLGLHLPGPGTIYLGQDLKFKAPVFIGDEITAIVEVTAIRRDKPIATLRTYCVNQKDTVVIDGVATVKYA
ncbi:MaoC family dehydratase [Spongiibacter sp. KMU-166]|uniref:MaoC family dehydratase n=1 Tax=Spongiibacter thalassae TaxID=2721624 RepID=A0ABX1GB89_9GAMM|nr:MaoC family dehydratase [Spongiibacter thalassae]NKI16431.1 MaoC family dehydratase [Spongiibacter thalassae]